MMQIEPLFLFQSQDVPVHPYDRQLESDVLEAIGSGVQTDYQTLAQQKIAPLECPVHHQHATMTILTIVYIESAEAFEGDYRIEACCPDFQKAVAESLHLA